MAKNNVQKSLLISTVLYSTLTLGFIAVTNIKEPLQHNKDISVALSAFQKEIEKQSEETKPHEAKPRQTNPEKTVDKQIRDTPLENHIAKTTQAQEEPIQQKETSQAKPTIKESIDIEREYLKINQAKIRDAIARNQRYPASAIKMNYEGICTIIFRLHPSGKVDSIKIVESSGFTSIDKSAIQAVEDAALEMPKPLNSVSITIPIEYKLN
jgi:protein TonB